MNTTLTLGQAIRSRRTELALTQEELAERIGEGVRQAEVSRLEHDRVGLPRRARLEAIAGALELPIGELLARSGWAGAEAVPWVLRTPSERLQPEVARESSARAQLPTVPIVSSRLPALIEQARQTINRTEILLSQSDQTYASVCQSITRANRLDQSERNRTSH